MNLYKLLTSIIKPIFNILYKVEIKGNKNLPSQYPIQIRIPSRKSKRTYFCEGECNGIKKKSVFRAKVCDCELAYQTFDIENK